MNKNQESPQIKDRWTQMGGTVFASLARGIKMGPRLFFLGGFIALVVQVALAADGTTSYSDSDHRFSVSAAAPWVRDPAAEKKEIVLALKYGEMERGKMRSTFNCQAFPSKDADIDIDEGAKGMFDKAKAKFADQGVWAKSRR